MNETELDEMLNQWDAPPAPAHLRERLRTGQVPKSWSWFAGLTHPGRKGLSAGALLAGAMCVFVVAEAFPQALGTIWSSPATTWTYEVESDVVKFAGDGSPRVEASLVSYSYHGHEIVVNESHPGNPAQEAVKNFHNGVHMLLLRFVPGLVLPSDQDDAWFKAYVDSGCVRPGGTVKGHESLLTYATTRVQYINRDHSRSTLWMAPDLGCFPLKNDYEEQRAGGSYALVTERLARRVMIRH